MEDKTILETLERQSTWRLFLLTLLTFGIYGAHYACTQSKIINRHLPEDKISISFMNTLLIFTYAGVVFLGIDFFLLLINEPSNKVDFVYQRLNNISFVILVIWGFKARNRMNFLLGSDPTDKNWYSAIWTFLFSPYYFNYKLNVISMTDDQPVIQSDS